MLKAIIFDVGGTLTDYFTLFNKIDQQILKECGIKVPLKKVTKIINNIDGEYSEKFSRMSNRKISRLFAVEILKRLGGSYKEPTEYQIKQYHIREFSKRVDWNKLKLFPDVLTVIKKLKNNFRIVTLSNTHDEILHEKLLKRLKLYDHFEFHTDSATLKSRKPAKKIFLHVLKKLNINPSEVAIVGDTPFADIAGGNINGNDDYLNQ